jgi:hypothetical protein
MQSRLRSSGNFSSRPSLPSLTSLTLSTAFALAACAGPVPPPAPPTPPAPAVAPEPVAAEAPATDATSETTHVAVTTATKADEPPAPDSKPVADDGPKLASRRFITWIYNRPSRKGLPIGYVRIGTWIDLQSDEPVKGEGCRQGFRLVKPFGYVCPDDSSTQDRKDPLLKAMETVLPKSDKLLPYRYALSSGAPMYGHIPTEAEQTKAEGPKEKRGKRQKLGKWASGHEELAEDRTIDATDEVPAILVDGKFTPTHHGADARAVRKWIPNGSMLAYSHAFTSGGRTWLLSADLTVIPADRVRPFRTSTFHGFAVDAAHPLPAAWSRHDAVARYKREGEEMVETGEPIPPRTFLAVTDEGAEVTVAGKKYLALREAGLFVKLDQVALVKAKDHLPVSVGASDKWIEVHIRAGTLTAYEGAKPVYTTLISPGAGGVAPSKATNEELVKLSTTPLGTYRIAWKDRAAPMSPEKGEPVKFWIADVPYTQYFRAPFALHVAYWHEDFGMPKSAGCVNVSPEDGKFLFGFTEPKVPTAWGGVGPGKEPGLGTVIVVSP